MPFSSRFEDAFCYANQLHSEQHRKASDVPYVTHLMAVAALVAEYGGNEDQVIAALLHDVVEDQGGAPRLVEIRERFGETVAHIVDGCTDTDVVPKPPWRARKEAYIERLHQKEELVRLVAAADKLHNARCIVADQRLHGDAAFDRFQGGKDGTLWYYRTVTQVLGENGRTPIVDELERTGREMHRLAGEPE